MSEARFRGRRWFLLRDPSMSEFLRIHETAWHFLERLDGIRTVDEAWRATNEAAAEVVISQPESVELLGLLHERGLLRSDGSVSAASLGGRFERTRAAATRRRWASLLSYRIPLLRPDAWLARCLPYFAPAFSVRGLLVWGVLLGTALVHLVGRGEALWAAALDQIGSDPLHWLSLAGLFVAIKCVHEWSHGIACRHFAERAGTDGSVPEMGVVWIALLPIPYVDATSSWQLPSKWQRAAVALAGIYAELAIASVAAVVWAHTGSGWLHSAAAQVLLVAGVSTILFNANPLLRFDGYYALSDLLEIPNLSRRSQAFLIFWAKRGIGVRGGVEPCHVVSERPWLVGYGLLAAAFRVWVLVWLLLALSERAFFIGLALACYGALLWLALPICRLIRYLLASPELAADGGRPRTRALAGVAVFASFGAVVPLPEHAHIRGVLEPVRLAEIHLADEGWLRSALPSGTVVGPDGAPLAAVENRALRARQAQLEADLARTRVHWRKSHGRDPLQSQLLAEDLALLEGQRARLAARLAGLSPRAPFEGMWIAPDLDALIGAVVRPDPERPLGIVADFREMRIRAVAGQDLGPRLVEALAAGGSVELRLASEPGMTRDASLERAVAGNTRLPHVSLGLGVGGEIRTLATGEAIEPFFELRLRPEADAAFPKRIHERATVRVRLAARTLLARGWNAARQLLQQRSGE